MLRTRWAQVGLAAVALASPGAAEGERPAYFTASFTDRNALFIENLAREEVRILENGSARKLELMARDEIPVVYGILFDLAIVPDAAEVERGRRGPGLASARDIAYELIDKYLGRQACWVGAYDRELRVALEPTTDGFQAKDAIQRLSGSRRPAETYLYGALVSAVQRMSDRPEKRRVLLVFLDSVDLETAGKAKPLKNLLSSSNVELFVVSFAARLTTRGATVQFPMAQGFLRDLAGVTAGEAFFASDYREHLNDISRRVYNQVRTFYTFGFLSTSSPERPARLAIECVRPGAKVRHHPTLAASP